MLENLTYSYSQIDATKAKKKKEERYSYQEKQCFIAIGREEYHKNLFKKFQKLEQELFFKNNASFLDWLLDVATSSILGGEVKRAFVISVNKSKSIIQEDKVEFQVLTPAQLGSPAFSPSITLKTTNCKLLLLSTPTCLMSPPKSPDAVPLGSIHQAIMEASVVQKTTDTGTFMSC